MKFLEALSQQGEQQIKLHNFCESLRLNEEPLKIWLSNHEKMQYEDKYLF
jgi:sRNA-binding regulator protein Hfq